MIVTMVGWVGAFACVGAYGMVSMGKWSASSKRYQIVNVIGAVMLCVVAAGSRVWPSVTANIIWAVIGAHALTVLVRDRRAAKNEDSPAAVASDAVEQGDDASAHVTLALLPTQATKEPAHLGHRHASEDQVTHEDQVARDDLADAAVLVA